MVMVRNSGAKELFDSFCADGRFHAQPVSSEEVIRSQKRGLIRKKHYAYAFERLAPLFRYGVSRTSLNNASWNHYAGAFLLMLNMKLSENPSIMDTVFRLPRPVLYGYVSVVKLLMSF
jgi:hypothetical protein